MQPYYLLTRVGETRRSYVEIPVLILSAAVTSPGVRRIKSSV